MNSIRPVVAVIAQGVSPGAFPLTLSLFLVMALMTLRLWELTGLAVPLLVRSVGLRSARALAEKSGTAVFRSR